MEDRKPLRRKILAYITVCFFLSGLCGLIYQIVWTRVLNLIFGHTTFAISTVITAFMTGLALGSFFLGKWADRIAESQDSTKSPGAWGASPHLLMYGILEAIVGAYCLLTPLMFKGLELIFLRCSSLSFYPLSIVRFILSMALLLIPTFCMGGTLPLLSKFLIQSHRDMGRKLGLLYFINTLGAVAGTVLAGFFLIRIFGMNDTLRSAAAINLWIGALIYFLNKDSENIYEPSTTGGEQELSSGNAVAAPQEPIPEENADAGALSPALRFIAIIFAFTGFASMVYELSWTRALSLAMGSSTYAFSAMLATFLFGIALGSKIFSHLSRRNPGPALFGWLQVFIGLSCLGAIPLLGSMPLIFIRIFPFIKQSYDSVIFADFLLCFAVMIIPTTLMGVAFPLAAKLHTRSMKSMGGSIGSIYAINTVGCILGSFLTGFVLIPFIGIQSCLKIAVLINLLGGLICLMAHYERPLIRGLCGALILLAIIFSHFIPPWNRAVMSSGSFVYADLYDRGKVRFDDESQRKILFYRDGISATVSVHKIDKLLFLRIDGKTDASTTSDMLTQLLLGYLPYLYHGPTQDVNILGLGSGITAKAVLDFPEIHTVACTEIEPAVIEANSFFAPFNGNIFSNPRFTCTVADGRNFLLASKKKYDLILSEPSNPWIAGIATLFTTEFFGLCRERLKDGGIFCQWLHLYSMNPSDVKMVLRTFYSNFPHGVIWHGTTGDVLLLGSMRELVFNYGRYEELFSRNEQFRKALQDLGIGGPDVLLAHYICSSEEVEGLTRTALLNTDDRPILEFSAPLNLYNDTAPTNIRGLYSFKTHLLPASRGIGENFEGTADFYLRLISLIQQADAPRADRFLAEALSHHPSNTSLRLLEINNLLAANKALMAKEKLNELIALYPHEYQYRMVLGALYAKQGELEMAEKLYRQACRLKESEIKPRSLLIDLLIRENKTAEASSMIDAATADERESSALLFLRAQCLMKDGDYDKALPLLVNLRSREPLNARVIEALLLIYNEKKLYAEAVEAAAALCRANPDDSKCYVALSRALLQAGNEAEGRKVLMERLKADPFNKEIIDMMTK
jgi:spermidine synthase